MKQKQNATYLDDMKTVRSQVIKFVTKAKYTEAVKCLRIWKKKYPNELFILTTLATLPYEDAFATPGPRRDKAYQKAATNLKPFLRKLRGLPIADRMRNRNEYYWFSQQHLKQYNLGVEGVKKGLPGSYYSQGVGAANLAYKILLKNPSAKGLLWAKRAEKAWLNYFRLWDKTYHDPWLWYALALGLQGRISEMEKALKKSSKLAGISYLQNKSLIEIRDMVQRCKNTQENS